MSSRLSTRLSIRWVPGEPSEPTNTLVMSVGGWYVDLRITKADGSIEWGMAGERLILSREPLTCKWTHWIDSRGYTEPDIGSFHPVDPSVANADPATDTVETGSMLNPETNVETPYEEVWRALRASHSDRFPWAWIVRSMDKRTFLAQVGGDFLALRGGPDGPVGEAGFCARRETWDGEQKRWTVVLEAGESNNLPALPGLVGWEAKGRGEGSGKEPAWTQSAMEGDVVELFGEKYVLCALERVA
ncbi:hypothetical protein G647_06697 [Cladophialophora carrionii CBS 160.54]|uniref:Protein HRI1 n=1 Tax=Cladophialophora carrionii CBS 160.54 TaxID=1279043 RepID=V9D7I6_9EURO|nr:uncharacterized protein G647_06697 [Cladophialophora carrionii CBS 160.54]ETI22621.1 hypothetical protein G647_06697 [Cladophialophora carrionii CBS 160.54]